MSNENRILNNLDFNLKGFMASKRIPAVLGAKTRVINEVI